MSQHDISEAADIESDAKPEGPASAPEQTGDGAAATPRRSKVRVLQYSRSDLLI
ncbi:hypothetical protein [Actinokineospora enzanensis]|uniref:hypothetical protein n=1 Tax=Actinokineospora enzanensis TaxID=155975 RepID=UPI00038218C5|nr:hypothetical protein [Actinokineospora enzanensis]